MMNLIPRTIVNGAGMRLNTGKVVSIMVKVEQHDGSSMFIQGTTTDDASITVTLRAPIDQTLSNQWVEVIGTPTRPDAINASEVILFPASDEDLDTKAHNMMIQFLTNSANVYNIR